MRNVTYKKNKKKCCFLKINIIFVKNIKHYSYDMDLSQFSGFLVFLTIFTMGFWLMIFLITFIIPYWLIGYFREAWKFRKEGKAITKK